MTPPNNTVAGLAAKWRNNADRASAGSARKSLIPEAVCELRAEAMTFRLCANALEAALASPAPSAGVGVDEVDDAMAERAWRAGRVEYSKRVKLSSEWDEPDANDIASMRAALTAALAGKAQEESNGE